jgi:RNA polymerase sigma-70 factor (ECF subfamily)
MALSDADEALVRAARADEPGAVDRLCARWLPEVLAWAVRLGGPKVDAEDVAHDAMIVVIRRLSVLQEPRAFPAWLYDITRKTIASHRRKAWVRRWIPGAVPDRADDRVTADPAALTHRHQVAEQIWHALDDLRDHHREVLVLCDLEERPDSEVSEMLGVPKGTVKSRLRRARKELRSRVGALSEVELPSLGGEEWE